MLRKKIIAAVAAPVLLFSIYQSANAQDSSVAAPPPGFPGHAV